jgi:hypothetical protein
MHKSFSGIKIDSEYKDAGSRNNCLGNHKYIAEHPLVGCKLCLEFEHFPFAVYPWILEIDSLYLPLKSGIWGSMGAQFTFEGV